jgi:hypothetical protein
VGLAFGLVICAGLSTTIGRACHACDDPFLFSITTYVDKGTIAEGGVGGRGAGVAVEVVVFASVGPWVVGHIC